MAEKRQAWKNCAALVFALLLWETAGSALLSRVFLRAGIGGLAANAVWYLGLFLMGAAFARAYRADPAALGLQSARIGAQLLWGIALACMLGVLFVGVPLLAGFAPSQFLGGAAPDAAAFIKNCLFYLLLVGTAEELAFRGVLCAQLRRATASPWWTAALSALAFGAYHYLSARSLLQVACTALIGFMLALPKEKRPQACTLLSVTVAHGLYNVFLECVRWNFC